MLPEILYEDNHVLAVNKPSGLLTQPTEKVSVSLETQLKAFLKERDAKPGNVFLHAIHRLDQQASGIVLFAKSQKGLERLSASMRDKKCIKRYVAIVEGNTPPATGSMVDYLVHGNYAAEVVSPSDPEAKRAELTVLSCQSIGPHRWRLEIELITGRYHQIRSQLASRGLPIIGDGKYGSTSPFRPNAIALHHGLLSFPHPTQPRTLTIEAAVPEAFLGGS